MPKVSIITPLFNRQDLVSETWESIKNQTYTDWEWIVVDDGSNDGGAEYIREIATKENRVKLFYRRDGKKGPSRCRNIGVEKSTGYYLVFLDADDLLADFCLEERISFMEKKVNLDFSIFKQILFKRVPGDLLKIFNLYADDRNEYLNLFLRNENPWQTMAPIWKKNSFLKLDGFNEELIIMEDPELHTRALINKLNFEVVKDSRVDCFYRQNSYNKEKEEYFYELSIKGRIYFIKRITNLIKCSGRSDTKELLKILYYSLIKLLKFFLLGRLKEYEHEYYDIIRWSRDYKIISKWNYLKIRFIGCFFLNDSFFVKAFKLKGILYRFLN